MNKKTLIAASLILGISSNTILAETTKFLDKKRNDVFEQAKDNSLGLRSTSIDVLINTKNLIEDARRFREENRRIEESRRVNVPKDFSTTPKNETPKSGNVNSRLKSNRPEESITLKLNRKNKKSKTDPNKFSEKESLKSHTSERNKSNKRELSKRNANLYGVIYNARNLEDLKPEQIEKVKKLHKRVLKTEVAQNVLDTIIIGEDGGLLVVVGKGTRKGKEFRHFMRNNLTTKTHPAYQFQKKFRHNGKPCFFHTKYGHSTASGFYQITKTNFDRMAKYLGIKDFSAESQKIMALELIRTGQAIKVPGNFKGRGYIELLKGSQKNSIIYGTDDWQSSPYSRWSNKNTARNYLGISQQVTQKTDKKKSSDLKDQKFFQSWIDETEREAGS